jgi:hypothetical protein
MMGPASAIKDERLVQITDKETWDKLWLEHRGKDVEMAGNGWALIPEIDFELCEVIAKFRGESGNSNGEYVVAIEEFTDHMRLRFDSSTYQTMSLDGSGGGVSVTPFGIWVLPRVNGKKRVIEENVQGLLGEPPIWEVQATFEALK